jgi:hypothetical protein
MNNDANNDCDGTCQAETCPDCHAHVHPWETSLHTERCPTVVRREVTRALAEFTNSLRTATAVLSKAGTLHAPDCSNVKAHLKFAQVSLDYPIDLWNCWRPWKLIYADRIVGKTGRCCSPSVMAQKKPRRLVRRLTGLGWPEEGGRCAKGRLPRWTRETAR